MPMALRLCSAGMDVELRHLRALVAIAAEGSITAAAARLHVTQPALSRTLYQLEQRVGAHLVERTTRRLRLTAAGEAFHARAVGILADVEDALAEAAASPRPLRLGYVWAALGEHTTPLLRAWREAYPEVPLQVHRIDERTAGLVRGDVDLAVLRTAPDDGQLRVELLYSEPRLAALPVGHRFADRDRLTLADLCEETIALVDTVMATTTGSLWPAGVRPRSFVQTHNIDEWLTLIAGGGVAGVTTAGTAHTHAHPGVRFVPLTDAPPVPVFLVWPRRHSHRRTHDLVELARRVVAAPTRPAR
jgi:DNA-binding transcriptional LysR family regulator